MKEFINEIVIHRTYGEGKIISFDNMYIKVKFNNNPDASRFSYPGIFNGFLEAKNPELQKIIKKDLEDLRAGNYTKKRIIRQENTDSPVTVKQAINVKEVSYTQRARELAITKQNSQTSKIKKRKPKPQSVEEDMILLLEKELEEDSLSEFQDATDLDILLGNEEPEDTDEISDEDFEKSIDEMLK